MQSFAHLDPTSRPGRTAGVSGAGLLHEPSRPAAPAWQLPSKYQPLRVLGTGGMGTVVLARDRNLGRLLAVKLLRTECNEFLERLRSEARLLARLEHPAIVRVHELDVFAGRTYLAMEYVRGGNLALARLAPVPLVRTLRCVVDALAHAHEQGIVHRDVKPENVLLVGAHGAARGTPRVRSVLTDFGLAAGPRHESLPGGSDAARATGAIVGTPLTMSPEQTRGEAVGPASDVFSFGVTLYRQLTGAWPFQGRTVADLLDAIRNRPPAPVLAARDAGRIPSRLTAVVERALAKDPGERFASMGELAEALDRFLRPRSLFFIPHRWFGGQRADERPRGPRIHPEELS